MAGRGALLDYDTDLLSGLYCVCFGLLFSLLACDKESRQSKHKRQS